MSTAKLSAKATNQSVRNWNKWLAAVFALQGVVILVLSDSRMLPVATGYIGADTLQSQAQGHTVLATSSQHLFDVNLTFIVAAFLFMAAIAHGLAASTGFHKKYENDLKSGANKVRWIEYAFSASTMAVAVGLVVGVQDIALLLTLFGVTALASLYGLVIDMRGMSAGRLHWPDRLAAGIAALVPWAVIAAYLLGGCVYGAVPGYAWWIAGTMFVSSAGFAVNFYLQHCKRGKWTNYLYGERVFMILSLVAKTALAWQIFAGSLHP